jgi:hypothetical protein
MKHQLDFEYDYSCLLFGVLSQAPSYRLCWSVNQKLGLNFACVGEHSVKHRDGSLSHHALYLYHDEANEVRYWLVENFSETKALVPELKRLDYILKIDEHERVNKLIINEQLKSLPDVLACYEIDIDKIKGKDLLIFE